MKTSVDLDTIGNAKPRVIMLKDLIVMHAKKQHGTLNVSIYTYVYHDSFLQA